MFESAPRYSVENMSRGQRASYLLGLSHQPLPRSRVIGYHGTSLETLRYIVETGILPGFTREERRRGLLPRQNDIFFYPKKRFPQFRRLRYVSDPFEEASHYAKMTAQDHFLLDALGFSIADQEAIEIAITLTSISPNAVSSVENRVFRHCLGLTGIDRTKLFTLISRSQDRMGVVLAIDEDVESLYGITEAEAGDDLRLETPGGLDYRFISGVGYEGDTEELIDALTANL